MAEILDRKLIPASAKVEALTLLQPSTEYLANGLPVHYLNAGTQDLVKIELIFPAGNRYEKKPLQSYVTNGLIKEGSKSYTSAQIAETLDFYGAFIENEQSRDTASLVLYSLNKHLPKTLEIFHSFITAPTFPESELKVFLNNNKQRFLVNVEKVDYLARTRFAALLYGKDHYYGSYPEASDFESITREDIVEFYTEQYSLDGARMIVSGKVSEEIKNLIKSFFEMKVDKTANSFKTVPVINVNAEKQRIEKTGAVQSAIRIGRVLFNKTHPDFAGMQVLNTILGGYFGSRLMKNIREDKGFTYGIGSGLVSLHENGYFFISTEVGTDVTAQAIDEIYKELERLCEIPVTAEELDLVRNYILGVFMKSADGPFALADKFKSIIEYGLNYDYYDNFIKVVSNISPEELLKLANKYLKPVDMKELVVG